MAVYWLAAFAAVGWRRRRRLVLGNNCRRLLLMGWLHAIERRRLLIWRRSLGRWHRAAIVVARLRMMLLMVHLRLLLCWRYSLRVRMIKLLIRTRACQRRGPLAGWHRPAVVMH